MRDDFIKRKETARRQAAWLQNYITHNRVKKGDLDRIEIYLEGLAKNAGLKKEFREKGYIKDRRKNDGK